MLLRHAKSSWEDPAAADHDRPLAPRGERAAVLVRDWLARSDVRPETALCSTARRAVMTLQAIAPALGDTETSFEEGLYHADAPRLIGRLRDLPDPVRTALLVGHNPGLQDLALVLAAPSTERARVASKLPTGALVVLTLDIPGWDAVAPASAAIEALVLPRELEA